MTTAYDQVEHPLIARARKLGALQGAAQLALAFLEGDSLLGKQTIIEGLRGALAHDGSDTYHAFPQTGESTHDNVL